MVLREAAKGVQSGTLSSSHSTNDTPSVSLTLDSSPTGEPSLTAPFRGAWDKFRKDEKTMENKKIKIKLPLTRSEKEDVFVGINGHTWQIARGVEVELPWNVVKVLERQEKMLAQALEFENQAAAPLERLEKKG